MIRRVIDEWKEEYEDSAIMGLMLLFLLFLIAGGMFACGVSAVVNVVEMVTE